MPVDFTLPALLETFRSLACGVRTARRWRSWRGGGPTVTGWLASLVLATPAAAQFNGGDGGTGAKFSLIDPAAAHRQSVQDFHAAGSTRFGFRNPDAEVIYNLRDAGGRTAGFASLASGGVTVYDQRPLLVVRTTGGATHTTATGQSPLYPKNIVSGDYYRDYYLRPFKFGGYGDALGEVRYHVYADRMHEVNALSHAGGDIAGIQEVYVEYPVAFSSYQVYEGAALAPTAATGIATGAVIIRRPNGSLLGFTFPPSANNGSAQFVESGGNLLVRHHANLAAVTTSIKPTQLLEWGRRVFASPSHETDAGAVLARMAEELNPLPAGAFSVTTLSNNHSFHNQQINEQVAYDPLVGVYRFRSQGLPWGDAITNYKNKYIGGRVGISPASSRTIHLQHESNSPDTAAALQDANGFTLPVRLGIARSLGGDGVADWTGQFANKDPFTSVFEATRAWGRTQFPVRLQAGSPLTFNILNVVHNWGYKQCAAIGSVIAHTPLATSNRGVWSAVDLSPWEGVTGDFRGFSSTPTIWAWGIPGPGREEHFAHALEMAYPSVGTRHAQAEDAWFDSHAFSHFRHFNRHSFANGKVDLLVSYTELPETNEHRLLSEVEFIVNQDLTLGTDERLNIFRLLPNRILFYNAFFRSTAGDTLEPEYISISPDPNTPSNTYQTRILEGTKPSFALVDKRWVGDPANPDPDHMAGVEANFFVRVMSQEVVVNDQPANPIPLALRVGKRKPEGNAWDPWGNPIPHGYYVSYDLAVEQPALALKAGDRLKFRLLIMPYGGKTSNNELASAQTTYDEYAMPQLVAVESGTPVSDGNPWLPTVRTSDGRSARFTVRGGREMLTIAAEGFSSYRPPDLFRIEGAQRTQIQYAVNGHDGVTTYLDPTDRVGFSIPVDMTAGQDATFEFVQNEGGFYGFDGGSFEGWTDLTIPNSNPGPRNWALSPPAFPSTTHSGAGAVGQNISGGTQDSSHPTLVLRSQAFTLNGSGDLTAWLVGGSGSGSLAGTTVASLPANSTNPGFLGIALRNATTGSYVLSRAKSAPGNDWQQVAISAAELATLDQSATYTLDLIDACHGGWGWVAMDSVTIPGAFPTGGGNSPPTIGTIPDLTIHQGTDSGPIPFTVADAETPAAELTLTATAFNNTLVPPGNILIGGSGENRSITVLPAANRSGQTAITVRVSDGEFSATTSFLLTVTAPPAVPLTYDFDSDGLQGWTELTPPNNNNGPRHWALAPPAFPGVTHSGSGAIGQNLGGGNQDSSHPTLLLRSPDFKLNNSGPLSAWLRGGAGSGTLGASTAGNSSNPGFQGIALRDAATGTYLLAASRSDSGDNWQQVVITESQLATLDQDASYTLDLIDQGHGGWGWVAMDSVTIPGSTGAPNTAPAITAIADQTIDANTQAGPLAFSVDDAETDPALLTLAAASSNTTLVPTANIALGGSGADRTVTVTPAAGQSGSTTITITVSDGELTADTAFELVVLPGPSPLVFNFDDATPQGWTTVSGNADQQVFAVKTHGPLFNSSPGPQTGSHMVGVDFGYDPPIDSPWDGVHQTMWIRSPEFTLNGSGNLTAWLTGGSQTWNSGAHPMANTSDVPTNSINGNGFMGIALRQVESGNFLALRGLPENNAFGWTEVTIPAAEMAPYANDGKSYTLDFIDARHGSWGFIALDSVAIPGSPVEPPPPANPYLDWAAAKGLVGPAAAFDADPDGDGIANGLEFVLGGEPNPANPGWNSLALLPTAQASGNDLVFTFQRNKEAAYLNPGVEFNADLTGPWTTAIHGTNATITVTDAGASEAITVTIPKNGAPALFARLKVVEPAP